MITFFYKKFFIKTVGFCFFLRIQKQKKNRSPRRKECAAYGEMEMDCNRSGTAGGSCADGAQNHV